MKASKFFYQATVGAVAFLCIYETLAVVSKTLCIHDIEIADIGLIVIVVFTALSLIFKACKR